MSEAFEGAGARVLPLPPYSPDYTPIEEIFSKVKQGLRRAKARVKTELYETLGEVLKQVTPEDILGWFRHAGLCAPTPFNIYGGFRKLLCSRSLGSSARRRSNVHPISDRDRH